MSPLSSGSDDEVAAHDNGSLESGTASPVDIIHADETHPASVVHHHNDVDSVRENLLPTSAIPPRAPSVGIHDHHHKRTLEMRPRTSRFSFLPKGTVNSTHTGSPLSDSCTDEPSVNGSRRHEGVPLASDHYINSQLGLSLIFALLLDGTV